MGVRVKTEGEALRAFAGLLADVEEELACLGARFDFEPGEEDGSAVARPEGMRVECLLMLDGLDCVTASWMVDGAERSSEAAGLDEALRLAEWMSAQVDGGLEE